MKLISISSILVFSLVAFLPYTSIGQVKIDIRVKQTITPKAYLFFRNDEKENIIDSANKTEDHFIFNLPSNYKKGIYKLKVGKNINFDFIVGKEAEIKLETYIFSAEDSLKSILSEENSIFLEYKKLKKRESQLSWFLSSARDYYHDTSSFKKKIDNELFEIRQEFNQSALLLANTKNNLLISKLILLDLRPIVASGLTKSEERDQLLNHWWDSCNLTDESLLIFPELKKKLWDYFDLVYFDELDKEEQELAFENAAKFVLNLYASNSIKNFFRQSIYNEFVETDYKLVSDYTKTITIDGFPFIESASEIGKENSSKQNLKIGQKIIDIKVNTTWGKKRISEIKGDYKLLVFWSSWCPHCLEMLPELKQIYNKYNHKGFEIIALSVDEEIENCDSIITEKKLNWINDNIHNLATKTIKLNFQVDEVPIYFLFDKSLNILSLPTNAKQLEAKLEKLIK